MRVVVTGGAGFIGSEFVRSTIAGRYAYLADAEVVVFDKLTYAGNLANLAPVLNDSRCRFVRGDICSATDLDAALPGCDLIVNFAAESHVDRSITGSTEDFVRTNVLGPQQVFAAAIRHGVSTVLHVSSDEVYGSVDTGSATEEDSLHPNSPYAATKAGADLIARAYAVTYGLDVRISRSVNNYGPYQFPEKLIPLFVTNLLEGRPVPLYGAGTQVREWLFVEDHCRALAIIAEKGSPGEVYNVAGGQSLTNRALTALLLRATGRDWSYVEEIEDPRGAAHDQRYALDAGRIEALGFQPEVSFDDGLARTVRWLRDNRHWWHPAG